MKTPQEKAEIIAEKTFGALWRGLTIPTVKDLLERSKSRKISYLYGFHGTPLSVSDEEFRTLIENALQKRLDFVFDGALRAHVTIEYTEQFYAGAFGTFAGHSITSWYVTRK
jgi:hypothetical protein